jgi:beta-glucosidase
MCSDFGRAAAATREDEMAGHHWRPFATGADARRWTRQGLGLLAFAAAATLASFPRAAVVADERPPYLDPSRPIDERIGDLLGRLTLEEKVGLVHANGKFRAGGVERLGVPCLWTADGPHGVREEVGLDSWAPAGWTSDFATAMPDGIALAATWDTAIAEAYGRTIGEEARARGKHVILGPALNIQRTPLCGRNYDYFGEDPWLAGRITVGYVEGMQAEQTIACLKHYVANNQEKDRGSIDVQVDERPLREIYLPAFEAGVREGGALAVMGAYNQVRGEHMCHNDYLLNQVLKGEWGFEGAVISDWGGTHDTRQAALNGLDLEMGTGRPYDQYFLAGPFLAGLKDGTYPMSVLDDKVRRNLRMLVASGALDGRRPGKINTQAHWEVARRTAEEAIVLLKNEPAVLPLDLAKLGTIAVIGDNAVRRFAAGGNAAGVKAFHEVTALEGIVARVGGRADVVFSQGYRQPARRGFGQRDVAGVRTSELTAASPEEAKELADRAVEAARRADAVLFIGGLTHQSGADDEGVDRRDLSLPAHQDDLIARIVEANPRTAVVLVAGSPVDMTSWLEKTPSVVQAWYGGSEAGHALASVLFGDVSPSGKLPCTFPKKLADSPAHAAGLARQYPGEGGKVFYDEGLFVGYRGNDAKGIEPLFPFGHGLSYTRFEYASLEAKLAPGAGGPSATLTLQITNVGGREGAEVVQAYVKPVEPPVERPVKELKAFARVPLQSGETKTVTLELGPRAFAYYDPAARGWRVAKGRYELLVGSSSRDIRLTGAVDVAKAVLLH